MHPARGSWAAAGNAMALAPTNMVFKQVLRCKLFSSPVADEDSQQKARNNSTTESLLLAMIV
jgi:hypothetical protein